MQRVRLEHGDGHTTIATPRLLELAGEEALRKLADAVPLGRLGTPEDVALATLFLLFDSSAWITGWPWTSPAARSCHDNGVQLLGSQSRDCLKREIGRLGWV